MRQETKTRPGSGGVDARRSGSDLERRFPVALALYAVLAVLVWFTLDEGRIFILGRWVAMRWVPLLILGGLALRTVVARQAEKIRRGGEQGGSSTPKDL
jgi:hypothetical protein